MTFKRLDSWRDKWLLIYNDDNIIYLFIYFLRINFLCKNCKFFVLLFCLFQFLISKSLNIRYFFINIAKITYYYIYISLFLKI
jgi:hypothetical protein